MGLQSGKLSSIFYFFSETPFLNPCFGNSHGKNIVVCFFRRLCFLTPLLGIRRGKRSTKKSDDYYSTGRCVLGGSSNAINRTARGQNMTLPTRSAWALALLVGGGSHQSNQTIGLVAMSGGGGPQGLQSRFGGKPLKILSRYVAPQKGSRPYIK